MSEAVINSIRAVGGGISTKVIQEMQSGLFQVVKQGPDGNYKSPGPGWKLVSITDDEGTACYVLPPRNTSRFRRP